jgi:hypothetical protein
MYDQGCKNTTPSMSNAGCIPALALETPVDLPGVSWMHSEGLRCCQRERCWQATGMWPPAANHSRRDYPVSGAVRGLLQTSWGERGTGGFFMQQGSP